MTTRLAGMAAGTALALALLAGCSRAARPAAAFNGTWHLDTAQSEGVPAMMQGHSTVIHLTARGDAFTIGFVFDGDPLNISKFILDGKQHTLPLGGINGSASGEVRSGGRTIALEIHRPLRPGMTPVEQIVFTLEPGDKTIRRVRTVPGGKEAPQIYIYRRVGS